MPTEDRPVARPRSIGEQGECWSEGRHTKLKRTSRSLWRTGGACMEYNGRSESNLVLMPPTVASCRSSVDPDLTRLPS